MNKILFIRFIAKKNVISEMNIIFFEKKIHRNQRNRWTEVKYDKNIIKKRLISFAFIKIILRQQNHTPFLMNQNFHIRNQKRPRLSQNPLPLPQAPQG